MRVHELAKELGISSKQLVAQINDPAITSHLSLLDDATVARLRGEPVVTVTPCETQETQTVDVQNEVLAAELPPHITPAMVRECTTASGKASPLYKYIHLI